MNNRIFLIFIIIFFSILYFLGTIVPYLNCNSNVTSFSTFFFYFLLNMKKFVSRSIVMALYPSQKHLHFYISHTPSTSHLTSNNRGKQSVCALLNSSDICNNIAHISKLHWLIEILCETELIPYNSTIFINPSIFYIWFYFIFKESCYSTII